MPARNVLIVVAAAVAAGGVAGFGWARRAHPRGFRDVTREAGLRFTHDNDASPAHRFVETTGGGCAWLDFDNDGLLDLFAVQGGPAPGSPERRRPPHALYRNLGAGRFADVSRSAGLAVDAGYGQGASAADYDGDGRTDLLLTTWGGVRLFRNRGGRFVDVTRDAGLASPSGTRSPWTTCAAWADFDADGDLDLFVGHYAWWTPEMDQPCGDGRGRPTYCMPTEYVGSPSALYRNQGGRFTDASRAAGLDRLEGKALGAAWLDADEDGRPDLFVANDMMQNWLLRNEDGRFRDRAAEAGCATGPTGTALSGMGTAAADLDGDLREDLFVVNFSRQPRSYYAAEGRGLFAWRGGRVEGNRDDQPLLGFGVESLDFNLDGHVDLVIGNGHINRNLGRGDVTYHQRQQLLRNLGDGSLVDDRGAAGDMNRPRVTRGLAVADFDNDGRVDCAVSGPGSPLTLYRNEVRPAGGWIGFRLEGHAANRDGIGTRLILSAGGRRQLRVARSGSSYASRSDPRLLFGLGSAARVDRLEVAWPGGLQESHGGLRPGRYYLLRQGEVPRPDPRLQGAAGG